MPSPAGRAKACGRCRARAPCSTTRAARRTARRSTTCRSGRTRWRTRRGFKMVTVTVSRKMVTVTIFLFSAALAGSYVLGQQKPAPEVRRVVTKLDESGKAVVMIDERTRLATPRPPNRAANAWVTDKSLPDFSWTDDRGKTKIGLMPPKSGTVFRVVDFAPESASGHPTDPNYMMKIVGAAAPAKGRPPRHQTQSQCGKSRAPVLPPKAGRRATR